MDEPFQPFASSVDHLMAELECIDLLIRGRVATLRRLQSEDEHFRGLYISEQEVDELLGRPLSAPQWLVAAEPGRWADVEAGLARLAAHIAKRKACSVAVGIELRLERLQTLFALERFDIDVLLVCMAGELDLRYEKLYAYLQDDVTRKRPSIGLVLDLLLPSPERHLAARRHFLHGSALLRNRLIEPIDDPSMPHPTLLSRGLKPDDRIVQYLLGADAIDGRLQPFAELQTQSRSLDELVLDAQARRSLDALLALIGGAAPPLIHLTGPAGVGKHSVAAALCQADGRPLLAVQIDRLLAEPPAGMAASLALIDREARILGSAVLYKGVDGLQGEAQQAARVLFSRALDSGSVLTFLAGAAPWDNTQLSQARPCVPVPVSRPNAALRLCLWQRALAAGPTEAALDTTAVAARFKLTGGQIEDAATAARSVARLRGAPAQRVTTPDLFEGCRLASNRRLGALARKVVQRFKWADIVLPDDRIAQLREICNQMKYRERVYSDWGFGRKLAMGKGLTVLFAGPSGTGKTMAADVIAGELGLDLYKIDLSSVISKYIGETEKNLSRIFDEAETSNAILFFDEADALFGKRSEVKDSHDRYANIEVGYLLQRMEEYEGVAILATNLRKNMDEAFVRRLHFTLDLPFPDEADRHRIWQGIWPKDTPRDSDLDLASLAQRFEMTGGSIRNVALAAAFLAADEGEVVRMSHLIHATQREYQKTGKLLRDHDFPEHSSK
jgi:AAA+ superfamily predicted ATPase